MDALERFLQGALVLDLEVSPQGRIFKLGAVLGGRTLERSGGVSLTNTLRELSTLAADAACLLGHNLVRHDLRVLREVCPDHPLLRLPVVDTLALSPIAFPENPYHRLVKDYKLVRESLNDPVADARQAAVLFGDEYRSLAGLRQTEGRMFHLLHYLLATPESSRDVAAHGMELLFTVLGSQRPPRAEALASCRALVREWACASVPIEESRLATGAERQALAYTIAWLRIAGGNSVLPPWVRLEYPAVGDWIRRLRDAPCASPDCRYCRRTHDAREQLRQFFDFPDFRSHPPNATGGSLQRDIIEAGLRDTSLLAILPTGGGKSVCFQLPALVRHQRRGVLTIVISPLQALMKDQVDGLVRRTGRASAAALYGLLTPPERGDVLRRVRLGDIALLYVSPEQLRNRSFRDAVAQREIGCWVFDEAHCLSKWGHDFRPDYLYAGRFIRECATMPGGVLPPIACYTATAKRDVKEEILAYFRTETGRDLALFEGGVNRDNLDFQVQAVAEHGKLERIHDLLADRLPPGRNGSAIVFHSRRAATELSAEFLRARGWKAAHFHAGLLPTEKKRIQDEFLAGEVQVICATNAFGMGIDKPDVRLVVHADTPGSLENYLQEAGRAGRDEAPAECVLLYDEQDCEAQFRMGALSELSRRDIAQILRGLRKAAAGRDQAVLTAGEILRDEAVDTDIALDDRDADTKVRTAVAWLERADFIRRDENATSVFQARPLVRSLAEAETRMEALNLSRTERALWLAVLRELMNPATADGLTVDQLALLPEFLSYTEASPTAKASPEFVSAKILKILGSMARVGLLKRDTLLNAFVRYRVADHSRLRLDHLLGIDRKLVDLLAVEEPDPEGWMPLSLPLLNQRLVDEGFASSLDLVRRLLKSLGEDGRGFAGTHGSIELRPITRDSCRVRVGRPWTAIVELAEKRRRVAGCVLDTILGKIAADTSPQADLLVPFSFEELQAAVDRDLILRSEVKDIDAALERALMYLHEQHVITLQQGLAVFRSAMTIRLVPEAKGRRYGLGDYRPLEHHYRERVLQVHVMSEYARRGLGQIRDAMRLVMAYFVLDKDEFVRRYFATRPELLEHATTAHSYQRIVSDLANPAQIRVVTAPRDRNLLILAGPGSGKTRTVVHRCAYLLRVERVRPRSVLICCFNRHAAFELRRRLADLVGADARGVTVLTYHGLAMRLLGLSYAGRAERRGEEFDFDALITDAIKLLRAETVPAGIEPDEVRDRVLAGFQHILVDEYQDIDEPQYELISALAGRTLDDPDLKLSILAVGDDDQNIYTFRGANVAFIRRFQQDYQAEPHHLVENYRATRHLIDAANQLIGANTDRMKTAHPIRIDRRRAKQPPGGDATAHDPLTQGKVQVLEVPDRAGQTESALEEVRRQRGLGGAEWSRFAVLAETHRDLAQVRAAAERELIPVRWFAGRAATPPLHQVREIHSVLRELAGQRTTLRRATDLRLLAERLLGPAAPQPWAGFLFRILEAWQIESDDAESPTQEAIEFVYEACAESRRDFTLGDGIALSTVHSAKGAEYDHVVLIGSWALKPDRAAQEEQRRIFYVGMTRARQSLTVIQRDDARPCLPETLDSTAILRRRAELPVRLESQPGTNYTTLGLDDIHLGYPGQFREDHPVHTALKALKTGDRLELRPLEDSNALAEWRADAAANRRARPIAGSAPFPSPEQPVGNQEGEVSQRADSDTIGCFDRRGVCVARLSRKGSTAWANRLAAVREVRVLALLHRHADQEPDPARRERCRVAEWEVPWLEVVHAETSGQAAARG